VRVLLVLRYFYCPSLPIGGAERQALKLATRLIEKGVAVTVVSGQWEWGQPRREEIQGVPVHRHFTAWGMFDIKGLRRIGQYLYLLTLFLYLARHRNEYDLIHSHSAMFSAPIVALAGRLLHKKTVVRAMASGPWGDIKRLREGESGTIWGARWLLGQLKKADRFVALNRQVSEELAEVGVQTERIIHIPNGVETEQIERKVDYRLDHEIRVTFVGRLHPQKGVDVLLSALRQVQTGSPQFSWQLRLIGTGEHQSEFEAMVHQLAIDGSVEFLGQVDDPLRLLPQGDIFVLPSRSEGMSNALLEAMASGLPCIVTDIAGNKEIIAQGVNGLLVQPDNQDDLAAAMASLATDQKLRERLGQEAIRTVEAQYSLDSVASQYTTLYTEMLQSGLENQEYVGMRC
jgi:glycosyltransferase involved in cell wall biosynthesis